MIYLNELHDVAVDAFVVVRRGEAPEEQRSVLGIAHHRIELLPFIQEYR